MTGGRVAAALAAVRARIAAAAERVGRGPSDIELLAVSKTHPATAVREAFAAGQRSFGENRVQELLAKATELADLPGIAWHLIGSLQTNKVRDLLRVPGLAMVHSLDRERLVDELQRQLAAQARRLPVLLQIDVTGEASKHGCAPDAAEALLMHTMQHAPALDVRGVMAIGPLHGDPSAAFAQVAALRRHLRERSGLALPMLSLGMSGDLDAAIAAGSSMVRIGSAVFGQRS